MKKYLFSLILVLVSYVGYSQKGLSYQAVILDPNAIEVPGQDISGQPFVNGDVWMKFSIYNGSTLQFEEVQKTQTDGYGLVNLMIGSVSTSSFNALVWDASQKTLQVHVSFNQGASYTKVSDQKLTYNPYALFAETAGKLGGVLPISGGGTGATTAADARLNLGLDQVNNTSDATKPVSTATKAALDLKANMADVNAALALKADATDVTAGLALKANASDMTAALAAKADTGIIKTFVVTQVAAATIADADANTKGKIKLSGDLAGTADAPKVPGLALKEDSDNKSINVTTDAASDTKYPSVKSVKTYVDAQVAGATIADANASTKGKIQLAGDLAGTAAAPTVPGLALKENSANKSTNVSTDGASDSKYPSVKAVKSYVDAQLAAGVASATIADADASTKGKIQLTGDLGGTAAAPTVPGLALKANATDLLSLTSDVNSNTASITANTSSIAGETTRATSAELVLTNSVAANSASITANTSSIAGETTRATAAELVLTNGVAANTSSIAGETTRATAAELALTNGITANTASITANIAAINLKAPIASPTFTGTVTSPIYASAPQNLTDAATISWDPANGLNTNVTLGGNRTLSFSSTPASGSYGTLVVTQDGTGGRTLTLPSGTNKVLGSASTTTIPLSTAANAKDILNFYYDGLTSTYYWNVGQGYGIAETVEATNLASAVTGTLPVANGGTGAGTATAALTALGAQSAANLSTSISTDAASTSKYPAVKTIKDYVDTQVSSATIADADGTTKGKVQLSGDLAGTAASPSVIKLRGTPISSVAPTTAGHVLTYDVSGSATWAAPANAANTISGVVPVANGGTGLSSLTSGGAVYASSSSALTTGTLPLTAGGTGVTSQQAAINILTGTQTAGRYLRSDGTDARLTAIQAADVPTLNQNTTGTAANVTGTVAVANGGTGATTATTAFNALSPMTTAGDIIYGGTNGAATRLGIGANATVLQVANGIPSWASISTGDLKFVYSNNNIGIGTSTTLASATQGDNVAIGRNALGSYYTGGISGSMNIGIGTDAGDYNSTGANNVYVGASAGITNQTGSNNTFMGYNTATSANRGVRNSISNSTAIGANAVVTASNSIQLGDASVTNVATAGSITANTVTYPNTHGTANQVLTTTGSGTLTWSTPSSGVPYTGATGPVNLGAYSLTVSSFTIGQGKTPASGDNLAIGRSALNNTTSNGWPNIGLGSFSLNQTTDGKNNIGLGLNALYANTTGSANIGIGTEAARNAATSSNITAVGMEALKYESGAGNTALGSFAGKPGNSTVYAATTNSTFLGYNTTTGKTSDVAIDNSTAIGYGAAVTASNSIQLGNTSVTNVKTSGTLTAGDITYPKTHGTANQVLTTTGSGTLTFTTPVVAKPTSDQFTATAAQTSFTLTQTPITNTTVSPNVKPNVWMYINGVRTNNNAYTISGTTVTYTAANNNNYTIVVGDRIQFDYAY